MSDEGSAPEGAPRRNFIAGVSAIVLGSLAGMVPLISGITTLLDPLRRSSAREGDGMILVTRLSLLPDNGVPRKFTVKSDRVDAWTTYANTPIGAVYLRRAGDEITALNVVCPHAGCFVGLATDSSRFACPCHNSSFALDGSIDDPASPSPRDMDTLEIEVRQGDEIWVKFKNFLPGQERKMPVV